MPSHSGLAMVAHNNEAVAEMVTVAVVATVGISIGLMELFQTLMDNIPETQILTATITEFQGESLVELDIFEADLTPEQIAQLNAEYGEDDWPSPPSTPDMPALTDNLPNIPGPIDNLGTVLRNQSNLIIPVFGEQINFLQNYATELSRRALNLVDFDVITVFYDCIIGNLENLRAIYRTLSDVIRRIDMGSVL